MANTVSSLKRIRQTKRKTAINRVRKTRFRHQVREMRRLLDQKDGAGAQSVIRETFSLIDRAAKWGIIKKNTAARYKSRLHIKLQSLQTAKA
ncbi:MAG TPA: 30S ribosomal protein S20 [Bryobacteraceae bacterium]|nr:30S ribosomal protein S20 [Bryobacteraceae bacterium]